MRRRDVVRVRGLRGVGDVGVARSRHRKAVRSDGERGRLPRGVRPRQERRPRRQVPHAGAQGNERRGARAAATGARDQAPARSAETSRLSSDPRARRLVPKAGEGWDHRDAGRVTARGGGAGRWVGRRGARERRLVGRVFRGGCFGRGGQVRLFGPREGREWAAAGRGEPGGGGGESGGAREA